MDVALLATYLPMDRRHALAQDRPLPEWTQGTALLADMAGFTPLTDALAKALGPRRGAEELLHLLNAVYESLVAQIHSFGGSVIGFSGDGFLCWFDADPGRRALAAGLQMQQAMSSFASVPTPAGSVSLSLKVGIASGPVRRIEVGDPQQQRLDVLVGATVDRVAQAEQVARHGEIIAGAEVEAALGAVVGRRTAGGVPCRRRPLCRTAAPLLSPRGL
jgi:class 3 adenylate cyclase